MTGLFKYLLIDFECAAQLGYVILAYVERQQEMRRFAAALFEQLQHAQLPGVNA